MARVKVFGPAKDPRRCAARHGAMGNPYLVGRKLIISLGDGQRMLIEFETADNMDELGLNLMLAATKVRGEERNEEGGSES